MTILKPIVCVILLLGSCAIILWFTGFVTFVDPISDQSTLCQLIDARRFTSIGLQSISWDDSFELLIFTEPQYRFYSLSIDNVAENSLDFSQAKVGSIAERDKYNRAISYVKDQSLKATYMFRLDNNEGHAQKHIILLVTDKGTLSGDFKDTPGDVVTPSGEEVPDFSLAFCSRDLDILLGYIITSDIYGNTGYFIIGKFNVHWEEAKFIGLPTKSEPEKRPYFYLEVGDNPEEVFLVHPTVEPDPEAQLLASLPRSFMFGCKHLVLLDSTNGCVHVIYDFIGPDLFAGHENQATQKHTLKRANIPFEMYFKCGTEVQTDEKRCDVVKGHHGLRFSLDMQTGVSFVAVLIFILLLFALVRKLSRTGQQASSSTVGSSSTACTTNTTDGLSSPFPLTSTMRTKNLNMLTDNSRFTVAKGDCTTRVSPSKHIVFGSSFPSAFMRSPVNVRKATQTKGTETKKVKKTKIQMKTRTSKKTNTPKILGKTWKSKIALVHKVKKYVHRNSR